ncbi:hypothetical protein DFH09DRAFT_1349644 [Mycena vulgaris]|nr:hypothetical protein DFH09DRAFT_1349644 [Mycena vulgaris]
MAGNPPSTSKHNSRGSRKPRASDEERAAKHRQASREYYQRKTAHIREKNRLHAAEVQAAKKARRWRWDPPKPQKKSAARGIASEDGDDMREPSPSTSRDLRTPSPPPQQTPQDSSSPARQQTLSPSPEPPPRDTAALLSDICTPSPARQLVPQHQAPQDKLGRELSPTSAERVAIDALAALGIPRQGGSVDSVLEKAMLLTSTADTPAVADPSTFVERPFIIPSATADSL